MDKQHLGTEAGKDTESHITTGSIFDDLGRSRSEATNLKIRAKLMDRLIDYVEDESLTQQEAAEHFEVSQSRVSDLVNGRISQFTIDALANMCSSVGIEVDVTIDGAYAGHGA